MSPVDDMGVKEESAVEEDMEELDGGVGADLHLLFAQADSEKPGLRRQAPAAHKRPYRTDGPAQGGEEAEAQTDMRKIDSGPDRGAA